MVVEDEAAVLGSIKHELCVSRCNLTASAMLDFPLCLSLPFQQPNSNHPGRGE